MTRVFRPFKIYKKNIKFINVRVNALKLKGDLLMLPKIKFTRENIGFAAIFIFYLVVGIVCFIFLPIANYPPHVGIIGIFSLLAACGFFKKKVWTLWLVVILFFIATTFSVAMLYYSSGIDIVLNISMTMYLILTWIFTIYTVAKRKIFEM